MQSNLLKLIFLAVTVISINHSAIIRASSGPSQGPSVAQVIDYFLDHNNNLGASAASVETLLSQSPAKVTSFISAAVYTGETTSEDEMVQFGLQLLKGAGWLAEAVDITKYSYTGNNGTTPLPKLMADNETIRAINYEAKSSEVTSLANDFFTQYTQPQQNIMAMNAGYSAEEINEAKQYQADALQTQQTNESEWREAIGE